MTWKIFWKKYFKKDIESHGHFVYIFSHENKFSQMSLFIHLKIYLDLVVSISCHYFIKTYYKLYFLKLIEAIMVVIVW